MHIVTCGIACRVSPLRVRHVVFVLALVTGSVGCHGGSDRTDGSTATDAGDGGMDAGAPDVMALDAAADVEAAVDAQGGADAALQDGVTAPQCETEVELGTATGLDVFVGLLNGVDDDDLEPSCGPVAFNDKVMHWQAPSSGTWVFDTFDSDFDTVIHVRGADCRELACDDDAAHQAQSRVAIRLDAGEDIFIVVDRRGRAGENLRLNITESDTELDCADGIDNDRDLYTDCSDVDCAIATPERCFEGVCDDGIDNNGNGLTDCRDYTCALDPACGEGLCADGVDNDNNGAVDCWDVSCFYVEPCIETTCDDGIDNDGDGRTDCEDFSCSSREPCVEVSCNDGADNDGDSTVDCVDADCACSRDCVPDPCPHDDLGSVLGIAVARGNTDAECDLRQPSPDGWCRFTWSRGRGAGGEVTLKWTAPHAGTYSFDTSGSDFDVILYLLAGSCAGPELTCVDDSDGALTARTIIALDAAQSVIVVIDGRPNFADATGNYVLSITEL